MVTPLVKRNLVKKRTKKFIRHQQDGFIRLRAKTWRTPHGIDSRVRRRTKGTTRCVKIGYGNKAANRHVMPNGFLKFRVSNLKDIEVLMMHNRKYAAEIAANVSTRKRKAIIERANQLNIKVTNASARLRTEQSE